MWMVTWDAHAVHVHWKATVHVVNDRMCHLQRLRLLLTSSSWIENSNFKFSNLILG